MFVNSDLAHAAGEGTSVLCVIISHWFMHCLICELAHSCTELDQTLQLCRINFCFLFIFPRPASAFARMTNRVKISLAESSQTHMKAQCLWCCFGCLRGQRSRVCRAWSTWSTRSIVDYQLTAGCSLCSYFQGGKIWRDWGRGKVRKC